MKEPKSRLLFFRHIVFEERQQFRKGDLSCTLDKDGSLEMGLILLCVEGSRLGFLRRGRLEWKKVLVNQKL